MKIFLKASLLGVSVQSSRNYLNKTQQKEKEQVNVEQLRDDLQSVLYRDGWDYGSTGPALVRLAWHASGTYDMSSGTGGSNGATMRFGPEKGDGANAGLDLVMSMLQPIKQKYPQVSNADLWILASYVALEEMGGLRIPFRLGRVDATDPKECPPNGRLPDASKDASHIRQVFSRMGFSDREMVVLIGGGHALGQCHKGRSGYEGPWTFSPLSLGTLYFKELMEDQWTVKQWDGPKQFQDKTGKLMMLPTDLEMKNDPVFSKWVQLYKDDEEQFQVDFRDVFKKLTELGCFKDQ